MSRCPLGRTHRALASGGRAVELLLSWHRYSPTPQSGATMPRPRAASQTISSWLTGCLPHSAESQASGPWISIPGQHLPPCNMHIPHEGWPCSNVASDLARLYGPRILHSQKAPSIPGVLWPVDHTFTSKVPCVSMNMEKGDRAHVGWARCTCTAQLTPTVLRGEDHCSHWTRGVRSCLQSHGDRSTGCGLQSQALPAAV